MSVPVRDLSPFFAPRSIAVVGAGERATSSGGAVMQMLRQAGYGGRVVPVNPKGGAIFGYESATSIAAIDPPVDLAVIVIRPDAILDAVAQATPVIGRLAELAAKAKLPLMHSMMGTLPGKAEWFAVLEAAGVPVFNDAEEMAEAAGLLARYAELRRAARAGGLPTVTFNDRRRK